MTLSDFKRALYHHFKAALLLVVGAALTGVAVNALRSKPLPWEHRSQAQRLDESVARLIKARAAPGAVAPEFVLADEVTAFTEGDERVMVFDVRPDLFFQDGRIPGAKNFPREDFEKLYPQYADAISKAPCVIVYCAGSFCEESEKMAEALRKLGHKNIAVYKGGWEEWSQQGRKTEKDSV